MFIKISLLLLISSLSFAEEMVSTPLEVTAAPNCAVVLEKVNLDQNYSLHLNKLSDLSSQRFDVWQKSGFANNSKKRAYYRVRKALSDALLLMYFNDANYIYQKNVKISAVWQIRRPLISVYTEMMLPGLPTLSISKSHIVRDLLIKASNSHVEVTMMISPIVYCLKQDLVISDGLSTLVGEYR